MIKCGYKSFCKMICTIIMSVTLYVLKKKSYRIESCKRSLINGIRHVSFAFKHINFKHFELKWNYTP
jgi:hypothetical protein